MPNLSQLKRERMLVFLQKIKDEHRDDDDMLIALGEIESELTSKKYGLVWEQHEEAVDVMMRDHIPVFTEVPEREITAAPAQKYNFLLEGDNLHSLRLLEKTHAGKIDVIYIDPPYNTGVEDFVYDDKYVSAEDGFMHSKWLSFMSERLRLAKNLLSEEGAIFIQINDIEVAQLKCLCDEIFGEANFLNIISVNMKNIAGASGGGEDKKFKKNCEYILVYARNYDFLPVFNGAYEYEEISSLVQRYRNENISWKYTSALVDPGKKRYVASTVDGDGNEIKIFERVDYCIKSIGAIMKEEGISEEEAYRRYARCLFQTAMPQSSIRPRVMEKVMEVGITSDLYSIEYVPKTGRNKGKLYEQFYKGDSFRLFAWLRDVSEEIDGKLFKKTVQGTYWDFVGETKNLSKEGNVEFKNGKKPIKLIKRILELFPRKDLLVLDFFAGSGSTGHAVVSLNSEDGGTRSFILCTNNEADICEKTTYVRLCNVLRGYTLKNGKNVLPIPGNLKYYRTDFVSKDHEYLSDALLEHIREMIQLEHGVKIDGSQYLMVMSDEEADELQAHWSEYEGVKAIYASKEVLFTTEQNALFAGVEIHTIPDYYFNFELKEVGETW